MDIDVSAPKRPNIAMLMINEYLPKEILRKVLQELDIKSLCYAICTCRRWMEIIDKFELVEEAASKMIDQCIYCILPNFLLYILVDNKLKSNIKLVVLN